MNDRRAGATAERRREERVALVGGEILVGLGEGHMREIPVITYDLSRSGMAIVCGSRLDSGTSVSLRGEGMGNVTRTAKVKWCRQVEEGIYKAGLAFA